MQPDRRFAPTRKKKKKKRVTRRISIQRCIESIKRNGLPTRFGQGRFAKQTLPESSPCDKGYDTE